MDRGRYTLLAGENTADERAVTAMKARELRRQRVVCGDRVDIVGDTSGTAGALARIVRIAPRATVLRRTADDTDPYERIVVANADQVVIVTALADPEPRPRMIDRCIVAAYDAGMAVVLCLTKADLCAPDHLRDAYEQLGVNVVVTQRADGKLAGLDTLRASLAGKSSVLVGHSGVGKSTLVNRLVPEADRAVGRVNAVTGRGRQTSTSAVALRLPPCAAGDGTVTTPGWVVDTPGVRSFGLAHVEPDRVVAAFDDLSPVVDRCPRGCAHVGHVPDCALDSWVTEATESTERSRRASRVESVRRLLSTR